VLDHEGRIAGAWGGAEAAQGVDVHGRWFKFGTGWIMAGFDMTS